MLLPEQINSAQVVDTFYPVIDGVVQVVDNYAAIMNKTSYSCVVCPAAKGGYDDERLPYDVLRSAALRFPFSEYSVAWPVNPSCIKKLKEKCLEKDVKIVHFHSPFTQRDSGVNVAKALGLPIVATFHTKYYDDIYEATKIPAIARIVTNSVVHFYDTCDSVWACSEGAAETLRSYGYKGKITVMENGTNFVRPANSEQLKEHAREIFNITGNEKKLLFVGTQVWQKNMRLVLQTIKKLKDLGKDYRLYVAGTGGNEKQIKAYAKKLGLNENHVVFLGKVEDRDILAGLFLNADLFFFPSVYDTSALVLREASIMETPSLLVKGSAASGVVTPDVNGFVADENPDAMADKIISVIENKPLLELTGRNACSTIPVPWSEIIKRVYAEYAQIIDRKNSKK